MSSTGSNYQHGLASFRSPRIRFIPLLWSHYTQDGTGFAIGYKAGNLKSLINSRVHLQQIRYVPRPGVLIGYRPLSWPESNMINILRCKSDHWAYESEWRLIVELDMTIGTGQTDRHGENGESVSGSQCRCGQSLLYRENPAVFCVGNKQAAWRTKQSIWREEGNKASVSGKRLSIRRIGYYAI